MGKGKDWSEMMVDIKEHKLLFGRYLRKKIGLEKKAAQKVGK